MIRLVIVIVLLVIVAIFVGVIINASAGAENGGLDLDFLDNIDIDLTPITILPGPVLTALLVRFRQQVSLSEQIVLSFFFFSWRNCIYGRAASLPFFRKSLEQRSLSRLFYWSSQLCSQSFYGENGLVWT